LGVSTFGYAPQGAERTVVSRGLAFTVIWDTDIISDAIRPYTDWKIFLSALDLIVIAQVRYGAFLYTGFVTIFNANFI